MVHVQEFLNIGRIRYIALYSTPRCSLAFIGDDQPPLDGEECFINSILCTLSCYVPRPVPAGTVSLPFITLCLVDLRALLPPY